MSCARSTPHPHPARAGCTAPRVFLAGRLTALEAPGGGEVQMLATARALAEAGVEARPWRPWEERLTGADLLHLFGSLPEHLPLVEAARRAGIPVVLSPIAWFDLAASWAEPRPLVRRAAACAMLVGRGISARIPSWRRRLYHAVDLVMPNSKAEADQLVRLFGVAPARIRVVPNGADERFADADPEPFARLVGSRGFLLYAGRIEPRKNQLGFLRAVRGAGADVVVLGDPVPGHAAYAEQCRRAADDNVRFLGRLEHDDPMLASAYAACGCLALTSWFETPGLAALEAGMSGRPLVLTVRGATSEYFGELASYVNPWDRRAIRSAVLGALESGPSARLAEHVRENFSWAAAAEATRRAYAEVV